MSLIDAIWLALLQGITEFLPVSSSSHLILPSKLLGAPDQGLTFDVAVHLGSLMAVLYYFRRRLMTLISGCILSLQSGTLNEHSLLSLQLAFATLPVVIAGALFKGIIETDLRNISVIGITTIAFGVLLALADRKSGERTEQHLSMWTALGIGGAQALALIPGVSRSGVTITAALFLGLNRQAAARFSFLLGIPAIGGACLLKMSELFIYGEPEAILTAGTGFIVSAVASFLSIGLFLRFVDSIGLLPFAIYRVVLGSVLLIFFI